MHSVSTKKEVLDVTSKESSSTPSSKSKGGDDIETELSTMLLGSTRIISAIRYLL